MSVVFAKSAAVHHHEWLNSFIAHLIKAGSVYYVRHKKWMMSRGELIHRAADEDDADEMNKHRNRAFGVNDAFQAAATEKEREIHSSW